MERVMSFDRFTMDRRRLLLGAGALGLAGCAGTPAARDAGARFPQIQAVLDRYVAEEKVPGAVVGLRLPDGGKVYVQAGRQDYGPSPAMDRDTLFRIYSMTKPITGTAAALLIEDRRLSLDQPVSDFIPEFAHLTVATNPKESLDARPAANVMTIRHLLTHTSGLTYHFEGDKGVAGAYRRSGIFPVTGFNLAPIPEMDAPQVHDLDEMVRRLAAIPLVAEPGTAFNYSISLDVLGLVIQRAARMPYPDFLQKRLFDPISMDDTTWRLTRGEARRLAQVYDYSGPQRRAETGSSAEVYSRPVSLYAGGAGLVSSARDYLAFMTTLLDNGRAGSVRVMKADTAQLVRSDILPEGVESDGGFGFGGFVNRADSPDAGQFGWDGAAGTKAWLDPVRDYAAVMMVQFFPWGSVPIAAEVRSAVEAEIARGWA